MAAYRSVTGAWLYVCVLLVGATACGSDSTHLNDLYETGQSCTADDECSSGRCVGGFCSVPGCESDESCGEGRICVLGECHEVSSFACQVVYGDPSSPAQSETPIMSLSPLSIAFGDVPIDRTEDREVVIRNSGECNLTIEGVGLSDTSDAAFGCSPCDLLSYPMIVPPQRTATINVSFSPTAAGAVEGELLVRSDDVTAGPDGLVSVDLAAEYSGMPSLVLEPLELSFGYVPYTVGQGGGSGKQTVRITNQGTGGAALAVEYIVLPPGTDFALDPSTPNPSPMAPLLLPPYDPGNPDSWLDITVSLEPTQNADHENKLQVFARPDPTAEPVEVGVAMHGSSLGPPRIQVTSNDLIFKTDAGEPLRLGMVDLGQLTVSNSGQSDLAVELGIDGAGTEFSVSPAFLAPLPPGGVAVLNVIYGPSEASDPANPAEPQAAKDAFLRLVSNDASQPLTTVNLHGWAKSTLADDVLKVEMTYDNGASSWARNDYRDVDLELESPLGLSCRKPGYLWAQNPDGTWQVPIGNITDYCQDWTNTGLEGTTNWLAAGAYEEPERVFVYGLGQDLADGGEFKARVYYIEDCANMPTGLLANLLGVGIGLIGSIIGGQIGVPMPVDPSQITDLIQNNCWGRGASDVTVTVFINGEEVAAKGVRLSKKGDHAVVARVRRQDGRFTVVP